MTTSFALVLARAKQVRERDRVRFRLVGAEEQEELRRAQVFLAGRGVDAVTVGEIAETECPGQRVAAGVVADRPDVGVVRAAQQREQAMDQRACAARQPARCLVRDGAGFAGVTQVENFLGDEVRASFQVIGSNFESGEPFFPPRASAAGSGDAGCRPVASSSAP